MADIFTSKPSPPPKFKTFSGAQIIRLPEPNFNGQSLETALKKRRSVRNFTREAISLGELSQLLFAAQGVTGKAYGTLLRSAPSAGAFYPIEIYLAAHNIFDLNPGIYHYNIRKHALELLKKGNFRKKIISAGLNQEMLGDAGVTFIFSAIFDRSRQKYGERGYRYVYIEAGHISQNIALQAVSLGLGSVPVGAFLDKGINQLIEVDGETEAVIYLHSVGNL